MARIVCRLSVACGGLNYTRALVRHCQKLFCNEIFNNFRTLLAFLSRLLDKCTSGKFCMDKWVHVFKQHDTKQHQANHNSKPTSEYNTVWRLSMRTCARCIVDCSQPPKTVPKLNTKNVATSLAHRAIYQSWHGPLFHGCCMPTVIWVSFRTSPM